ALGMLKVTGDENKQLYSGKQTDGIYHPEGGTIQTMPGEEAVARKASNKEERVEYGKSIYNKTCFACHQTEGEGIPGAFPPLAKSDFLHGNPENAIDIIMNGKNGKLTVNGKNYDGIMPAQSLTDEQIANVLSFVYNSWGNNKTEVIPAMVEKRRKK
ncbi:MAG: cytochrome c, partial [Bacteroidia bacterium]